MFASGAPIPSVFSSGMRAVHTSASSRQDPYQSLRGMHRGPSRPALRVTRAQTTMDAPSQPQNLKAKEAETKTTFSKRWDEANLEVQVDKTNETFQVTFRNPHGPAPRRVLHWAVNDWQKAEESIWPPGTVAVDDKAVQTPLGQDGGTCMTLNLQQASCPSTLVFVIKELDPERWINGGGSHFTVVLKQPDTDSITSKVITAESTYSNWSLFNRLCLVNEVLDAASLAGPPGMALIMTWLRLSSNRTLPWYKNSNYQSKDIAHVQKTVAQNMAAKARSADDPLSRMYARMALAGLPRGGGNGDDIRMGILNIMRANGIKEGHRPGIDEQFLEQWHQKLHTNTTPDDIAICEAYLAFLHTNNHDDYWRVLWDRGHLSRNDLENFGKPIKAWPMHLPHLIGPFQHFLWILKVTHSGADLDTAFTMAQGLVDDETRWMISDILQNRNEWWVPGKIVDARLRLANYWKQDGASRDLLLLDIALEDWFRVLVERADFRDAGAKRDDLVEVVTLVLRNVSVALDDEELRQCGNWWQSLRSRDRWGPEWSLEALAAAQRTELSLAALMDTVYSQVQPCAERFGAACILDPKFIVNFGEEVVRGHPAFVLSPLIQLLEPVVRQAAGVSSWQIVSQVPASGKVLCISSLADVQGVEYEEPVVLIADKVGGMEDIPVNVQAVLTRSLTDVLSHVAIRARSQHTLLACCSDAGQWQQLLELEGRSVALTVAPDGSVLTTESAAATSPAAVAAPAAPGGAGGRLMLGAVEPQLQGAWALAEGDAEYSDKKVGRKSLNLSLLRQRLPPGLHVPRGITLPFGTLERTLALNTQTAQQLRAVQGKLKGSLPMSEVTQLLTEARQLVATGLSPPSDFVSGVASKAAAAGLISSAEVWTQQGEEWRQAWRAICAVWASKWTERAWLSRKARGVQDDELYMAVLLQQVVPAQYAFVLHTSNPITHAPNEAVGELVVGLGETLVGNHPGRALSFRSADNGATAQLSGFPSKRVSLVAPAGGTLIARSDANGEDLDDFAGAGLYDSVPLIPLEERPIDYAADPIMHDPSFRNTLLQQLLQASSGIKAAFEGRDQDIEGVYFGGKLYVVQARPQVAQKKA